MQEPVYSYSIKSDRFKLQMVRLNEEVQRLSPDDKRVDPDLARK
jgi:hypothetical protein